MEAAEQAISSKLLESSIDGADRILVSITGGSDLTLTEVTEAMEAVTASADQNANIIIGAVIDDSMGDQIRITVIATGFNSHDSQQSFDGIIGSEDDKGYGSKSKPDDQSLSYGNAYDDDDYVPEFLRNARF